MDRRTFLKLSAAGATAAALGQLRFAFGQQPARDLIVVSNAGGEGVAPSVSVLDPVSYEVLATLPLAGSYAFAATRWDFDRDLIWAGGGDDAVVAYRFSTGERILELGTDSSQNYTEVTPDGRWLIDAARFDDRFLKIGADPDLPDFGQVVAEFATYEGASPCDLTITADGRYAYAPDRGGDTLTVVRIEPFERLAVIPLETFDDAPLEPYMGTVSPTTNFLLIENAVVEGGSSVGSESIFDLADPENPVEVARLSVEDGLGAGPISSEITPDGRFAMVICRDSSELSIIDLPQLAVVTSVPFPEGSNPLTGSYVFGADVDTFFVPLPGRDAVAAVAVPDFEVATLIPVGARPLGAVYLQAPLPSRPAASAPLGAALAGGRAFPADCPDRCCGRV